KTEKNRGPDPSGRLGDRPGRLHASTVGRADDLEHDHDEAAHGHDVRRADPRHERADLRAADRHDDRRGPRFERRPRHRRPRRPPKRLGWSAISVFQIGTMRLTSSMTHAQAAKASARWTAAHAIATESPPTGTRPSRWTMDRSVRPNLSLARSASAVRLLIAIGRYTS